MSTTQPDNDVREKAAWERHRDEMARAWRMYHEVKRTQGKGRADLAYDMIWIPSWVEYLKSGGEEIYGKVGHTLEIWEGRLAEMQARLGGVGTDPIAQLHELLGKWDRDDEVLRRRGAPHPAWACRAGVHGWGWTMSGPVKVRLVPCPNDWHAGSGCMMLGPIHLCGPAMRWVRETFPRGATFREFWEQSPLAGWTCYLSASLANAVGARTRAIEISGPYWGALSAAEGRALCPYDEIEGWIRKVMSGRPEVVRAEEKSP